MKAHFLFALMTIMVSACASHHRDIASTPDDSTARGQAEHRQIFDGPGTQVR